MTVGELIGQLNKMPRNVEVCTVYIDDYNHYSEVLYVELTKHTIHPVIDGKIASVEEDVVYIH